MVISSRSTGNQHRCVVARTSSSSIEYLFASLNRSSIITGVFLTGDSNKGVLGQMLLLKIGRMASMLHNST